MFPYATCCWHTRQQGVWEVLTYIGGSDPPIPSSLGYAPIRKRRGLGQRAVAGKHRAMMDVASCA